MVLSDTQIIEAIDSRRVSFDPPLDTEVQVQVASIDLRLGNSIKYYAAVVYSPIELDPIPDLSSTVKEINITKRPFILHPGAFILAYTLEYVKIPVDLIGTLEGRSSFGRLGMQVHSTAGIIDPGFEGNITLEISNVGSIPMLLRPGLRLCQLILSETGPVGTPYGPERGSHYQGQRGPTLASS